MHSVNHTPDLAYICSGGAWCVCNVLHRCGRVCSTSGMWLVRARHIHMRLEERLLVYLPLCICKCTIDFVGSTCLYEFLVAFMMVIGCQFYNAPRKYILVLFTLEACKISIPKHIARLLIFSYELIIRIGRSSKKKKKEIAESFWLDCTEVYFCLFDAQRSKALNVWIWNHHDCILFSISVSEYMHHFSFGHYSSINFDHLSLTII